MTIIFSSFNQISTFYIYFDLISPSSFAYGIFILLYDDPVISDIKSNSFP